MKAFGKAVLSGIIIMVLGAAVIVAALAIGGWQIPDIYEPKTFEATTQVETLKLSIPAGAVTIKQDETVETVTIEYPYSDRYAVSITEESGVISMSVPDTTVWFNFSFWLWKIPRTVIKVPTAATCNLDIVVNAGEVCISGGEYNLINATLNAGMLWGENVKCQKFTGEVNAGAVELKSFTCPQISAKVDLGSLYMKINAAKADYSVKADTSLGSCNISDQTGTTNKSLDLNCSLGSIYVEFAS